MASINRLAQIAKRQGFRALMFDINVKFIADPSIEKKSVLVCLGFIYILQVIRAIVDSYREILPPRISNGSRIFSVVFVY